MPSSSNIVDAFYALLRAGLWEQRVRLSPFYPIDFDALFKLAEEQSVVGLIAAGLEHVEDMTLTKQQVMPFMKRIITLESRNASMNGFIADFFTKLREAGIQALLVKGQGIAQCYERPMWRAAGDVDLLLDSDSYEKAKVFLSPMASAVEGEYIRDKHLGMTIDSWTVELHGRLYCGLSSRIEKELDDVQSSTFAVGKVRSWENGNTQVPLLPAEDDAFYVFTHILQHFYKGGIGLRQISDWCRLLWTYREEIDATKLEGHIRRARLETAWRTFAAFAVDYLGAPTDAIPLYSPATKWKRRANKVCSFVLQVGNFGHKRDSSYYNKYPYLIRKTISLSRRLSDLLRHARIFPLDSLCFFPSIMINGLRSAARGE